MILIYLLVFLLILPLPAATNPLASLCLGFCHCDRDIVDCGSLDLTEVPLNIPNNTRVLILSDNEIDSIDATRFRYFGNLQVLSVRKNRLTRIPSGMEKCKHLDKLDLRSNVISEVSPIDLLTITGIRHVDLSRNLIAVLPKLKSFHQKSVTERLDLAANVIYDIGSDLFLPFQSLISLRLSRNRLTFLDQNSFSKLPSVESIDLSRNLIRDIRFLAFNALPSLRTVNLDRNDISLLDDGMFFACESLAHLNLSTNRVQSVTEGWMFGLVNLETLDLSYNQVRLFHPNAWSHTPRLKWLSLHSNRIQSLPSGSFRALHHLEELILSANSIDSLHKFALIGMGNLNKLDLSSNTLAVCVEDGAVLYNTSMPFLRSLKFRNNQLRVIPNRAFERFPSLEELDLTENPIATIHPNAFEPLQLKSLIMNSSSILCDCQISWFATWIYKLQLDRQKIIAKCSFPLPLQGLDVISIDSANLTCLDDSPRPKIVRQPEEMTALVGQQARFMCNIYGEGPLVVEWRVMDRGIGRVLVQDSQTYMSINTTAIINGTMNGRELAAADLILDNVSLEDRSEYQCVARNRFGSDFSPTVRLTVLEPPRFLNTPSDISIMVGQSAKFQCSATGDLRWAFDGGQFPAAEGRRLYVMPHDDHLYIMNVSMLDQGIYTCHATNAAGAIQASARLRVFDNLFYNILESQKLYEGESLVLECRVKIIPEVQRLLWKKDGKVVAENTQIFRVDKVLKKHSGEYSCELWTEDTILNKQSSIVQVLSDDDPKLSGISKKAHQLQAMASSLVRSMTGSAPNYPLLIAILAFLM
ncbi:unnamed protein product [Caenorhabditis bovis]|uniref:Ig-like domain-containing protein n=1 Tax=Caenorhabditis bovis TaxID=2654633 RepID=A0A8S1FA54_9PELO|nr:unnamed protein product [Caenorhabditis bovis]